MTDTSEAIVHAYDVGRWQQALAEAERCVAIYSSDAARLRPVAAWAALPLGLPVDISLDLIASAPLDNEMDHDEWAYHLAHLHERRKRVRIQSQLWMTSNDTAH